jgi:hypothetical protein
MGVDAPLFATIIDVQCNLIMVLSHLSGGGQPLLVRGAMSSYSLI